MSGAKGIAALTAVFAGMVWACGPQRVQTPESPAPAPALAEDVIVLLPDPDGGPTGRATVSNSSGKVELAGARESTRVSAKQPPAPVITLSAAEIRRRFGDVLSTLPPPPRHFTLYFRFESDELTEESRSQVRMILEAVKALPAPEVLVVGHTDTTGSRAANFDLGLKRADVVRTFLSKAGLSASFIEVASHGEGDLLVPTADNSPEPRNRRVEITVR
jgi:outer membrane protein OmpA-like peptidoglycan-associated protein